MSDVILPTVPRQQPSDFKQQYEIWRVGWEETQPKFIIENVRFEHDPQWNERFFSSTYIVSGKSIFWNFIMLLFAVAPMAGMWAT